jgi:hypothetical protein
MTRDRSLRLTLGPVPFELLPDGCVLVTLAPSAVPFGAVVTGSVLYPSLKAFLAVWLSKRQRW